VDDLAKLVDEARKAYQNGRPELEVLKSRVDVLRATVSHIEAHVAQGRKGDARIMLITLARMADKYAHESLVMESGELT
jgi:hypothetical protein